ncbi:MAG: D-alanyl-D-alanine carboxypeptidase family protein [Sphingorhabdus sp.]
MILAPILLMVAAPAMPIAPESAAPVAYLYDVSSGATLLSRDAERRIATASMAKMMTAWVVFEAIKAGKLKPKQSFPVRDATWAKWNNTGSSMFLKARENVSVENLLHGILTVSGNDASVVLAEGMAGTEAEFAKRMTAEARRMGMKNSRFGTANGWPDEGRTFSTAHDLALLADRIVNDHPALFRQYFGQRSFTWNGVTQANRNPLLGAIAGADGMKTGHSDEAGYCLVGTVQQGKRRLLLVIAGLSTQAERINEARNIMKWGFEAFVSKPLYSRGRYVAEVPVQLGDQSTIRLIAPRDLAATLPKGAVKPISLSLRYKGPVRAPFKKGAELAELIAKLPDGSTQVMPLVASEAVGKAGFFGRAWNGAKSLVGA